MIKTCGNCKKEFKLITQELEFYKKMGLPHPSLCPACRQERREKTRNDRQFYKFPCAKCKKEMITTVDPKHNFIVYCLTCYTDFRANVDLTKI